jgi:hypothetical protein
MKKALRDQIDELAAMGVAELEQQHRKLFGEEPATAHRQFLFRKIAWRLQADREGGLPESARELARAIAKDAPLRNRVISNAGKRRAGFPIGQSATTTITPDHDSRLPMPGGLIVKQLALPSSPLTSAAASWRLRKKDGYRPTSDPTQQRTSPAHLWP